MRRIWLVLFLLLPVWAEAQFQRAQMPTGYGLVTTHATDCTSLTTLKQYDRCIDLDDGREWRCAQASCTAPGDYSLVDSGGGGGLVLSYTVATRPGGSATGTIIQVTDGVDISNGCVTGGGSSRLLCRYTGTVWQPLGDGVGAAGSGAGTGSCTNQVVTGLNAAAPPTCSSIGTLMLAFDPATQTELDAHVNDTIAAHAASAISNTPSGTISATTVQQAINELAAEAGTAGTFCAAHPYHIDCYGAVPGGSAGTNTTAIQAAIDASQAAMSGNSGAHTVEFGPGEYAINATIHAKSAPWFCHGGLNIGTVIKWNGTAGVTAIDRGGTFPGGNSFWGIENCQFNDGTAKPGTWLDITAQAEVDSGFRMFNVAFEDTTGDCLKVGGWFNLWWGKMRFDGCGGYDVRFTPASGQNLSSFEIDDFTSDNRATTNKPGNFLFDNSVAKSSNLGKVRFTNSRIEFNVANATPKAVIVLTPPATDPNSTLAGVNVILDNLEIQDSSGMTDDALIYCNGVDVRFSAYISHVVTQNVATYTGGDCADSINTQVTDQGGNTLGDKYVVQWITQHPYLSYVDRAASALSTHTSLTTTAHGGLVSTTDPRFPSMSSPAALSAASTITCSARTVLIAGSGGPVTLTSNPPITAGTANGQRCTLKGSHATNTVTIPNGNTLRHCGNTGSVVVGLNGQQIDYEWTGAEWSQDGCTTLQGIGNVGRSIVATESTPLIVQNSAGTGRMELYVDSGTGIPTSRGICGGSPCPTTPLNNPMVTTSGSQPTCSSSVRGLVWIPPTPVTDVADTREICAKDGANAYAWESWATGSGGSRTTTIPLQLMSIDVANANAFAWTEDGTNFDYDGVRFVDAVTGCAFFKTVIPSNVSTTPAWNVTIKHKAISGGGGNAVLTVDAKDFANNVAFDAALTALVGLTSCAGSPCTYATNTSANLAHSTLSATNFDSAEAIAANNLLIVKLCRVGGNGSDSVNVDWFLLSADLRLNVD